jgi:hypothetical protein
MVARAAPGGNLMCFPYTYPYPFPAGITCPFGHGNGYGLEPPQMSEYSMNSYGCGRRRIWSASFVFL